MTREPVKSKQDSSVPELCACLSPDDPGGDRKCCSDSFPDLSIATTAGWEMRDRATADASVVGIMGHVDTLTAALCFPGKGGKVRGFSRPPNRALCV